MCRSIVTSLIAALLIATASAYNVRVESQSAGQKQIGSDATHRAHQQQLSRRAFAKAASSALATAGYCSIMGPVPPVSAAASETGAVKVKVTPVAHTFVASADKGIKPLRENDATRFFTNARIMVSFYGGGSDTSKLDSTFAEILDLTIKRKAEKGSGVTPGDVIFGEIAGQRVAPSASAANAKMVAVKDTSPSSVSAAVSALSAEGDVLILSPTPTKGTAGDGKVLAAIAEAAGLEAGARGGQVLGLLIDGPRDPQSVLLSEGGYALQPILWYSI